MRRFLSNYFDLLLLLSVIVVTVRGQALCSEVVRCQFVCLFVVTITLRPFEIVIKNMDEVENGCIMVHCDVTFLML